MPIYEYECNRCGHVHEMMQKMSDKPLTRCPECSGKLQKIISQSSFHLKGSGWYVTDYANKTGASSEPGKKKKKDAADAPADISPKTKESAKETTS